MTAVDELPCLDRALGLPETTWQPACLFRPRSVCSVTDGVYSTYSRTVCIERRGPPSPAGSVTSVVYGFGSEYPYLIFGRSPLSSHHFVGHDSVSAQHVVFYWSDRGDGARCFLQNLPSPNAVRVNGRILAADADRMLTPGEVIHLGKAPVTFLFRLMDPGDEERMVLPPRLPLSLPPPVDTEQPFPINDEPPPALPPPPPPPRK